MVYTGNVGCFGWCHLLLCNVSTIRLCLATSFITVQCEICLAVQFVTGQYGLFLAVLFVTVQYEICLAVKFVIGQWVLFLVVPFIAESCVWQGQLFLCSVGCVSWCCLLW